MIKNISSCTVLNNGVEMPWLGLGVFRSEEGPEVVEAVKTAIQVGYRSIDTAAMYENERGVGQAIRECSVPREKLFITTKVWNTDQGYDATLAAFEESRKKLGLDYIDLYLIHWPLRGRYVETWKALETLYKEGKVRAIGVSNFLEHHLRDIMEGSEIVPMVNQMEFHPMLIETELRQFCKANKIQYQAWSPLMKGQHFDHPILLELSKKHKKTPAQIVLRWDLQHEVVTIPKSVTPHRIKENADIFDFELTAEDMAKVDSMDIDKHLGVDPADA